MENKYEWNQLHSNLKETKKDKDWETPERWMQSEWFTTDAWNDFEDLNVFSTGRLWKFKHVWKRLKGVLVTHNGCVTDAAVNELVSRRFYRSCSKKDWAFECLCFSECFELTYSIHVVTDVLKFKLNAQCAFHHHGLVVTDKLSNTCQNPNYISTCIIT